MKEKDKFINLKEKRTDKATSKQCIMKRCVYKREFNRKNSD